MFCNIFLFFSKKHVLLKNFLVCFTFKKEYTYYTYFDTLKCLMLELLNNSYVILFIYPKR